MILIWFGGDQVARLAGFNTVWRGSCTKSRFNMVSGDEVPRLGFIWVSESQVYYGMAGARYQF